MKQIALTLILALGCLAETAKAQDAKAAIRQHYAAAKAYVEQQQQVEAGGDFYPVTQCFSVQVKQNLPGTGYHQEDVKLYYREEQDSAEQIYPDLLLDFATKRYNFAASWISPQSAITSPPGHITRNISTTSRGASSLSTPPYPTSTMVRTTNCASISAKAS